MLVVLEAASYPDYNIRAWIYPKFPNAQEPSNLETLTLQVRAPVEAMLEVASYPDFNICAMSFNFWSRLAKRLWPQDLPSAGKAGICAQGFGKQG